jgi:hypothetical protein
LFILAGAGFASLGLTAFAAAKAASVFFYALSVFPLSWLYRRLFAGAAVLWGLLYCLSCPYLLRYALVGLRDSANTFFIICLAAGLVAFFQERRWSAALGTALAATGMALTRGESVVHAGLGLACLAGLALLARPSPDGRRRDLAKVATAILVFALAIAPWVAYCQQTTGWPVTAVQGIPVLQKIEQATGLRLHQATTLQNHDPAMIPVPTPAATGTRVEAEPDGAGFSFQETLGMIPFYLALAAAGMWLRWRQRRWTRQETLLLGLFLMLEATLVGLFLWVGGDYLGKRYLAGPLPLVLGWAGVAMATLWDGLRRHLASPGWRRLAQAACLIGLLAGTWDGMSPARWGLTPKKQARWQAESAAATWIREHGRETIAGTDTPLPSTLISYHNGRMPILLGRQAATRIAALAGGDALFPKGRSPWTIRQILAYCQAQHVHFLVYDEETAKLCPELQDPNSRPPELVPCGSWGTAPHPVIIFGFREKTLK